MVRVFDILKLITDECGLNIQEVDHRNIVTIEKYYYDWHWVYLTWDENLKLIVTRNTCMPRLPEFLAYLTDPGSIQVIKDWLNAEFK